ncbi:restriction endonuclease subunit S [Brucella gallinifaecis]|uniref:restriction endonuclease subunit S n=1 Tax=Brucella gallinifaecis TaxID=215590 RepID=UPI00235F5F49|nr:restriction endonuclease subunit S [Brucella gallinifaecis]
MTSLELARLSEICSLVTDGTHDSPKLRDDGVPFIKGKHINTGRIEFDSCDFIAPEDHEKCIRRVKPQRDDILMANIGASIGDCARVFDDREFSIKNVALLRPDREKVAPSYFYQLVKSQIFQSRLMNLRLGAAQPYVSLEALRRFEIPIVKDLESQCKIGEVFDSYDNLIENNRRRIELLEQAARLLYREWFVHLRFPGHEDVKIINGLPEGWKLSTVFDSIDILSGGTPKTDNAEYWGDQIPFFTPKDTGEFAYVNDTEKMITEIGLRNCNSRLYPKDTLFITARGTVGKLRLAQRPMAMNQSCYALNSKCRLTQHYLYFALSERVNHLKGQAGGAVFSAIVVDTFKKIPLLIPSSEMADKFAKFASHTFSQIDVLSKQIAQLTRARDLLLPRLMDGRIKV